MDGGIPPRRRFRVHGRVLATHIPIGSVSGSPVAGILENKLLNTGEFTVTYIYLHYLHIIVSFVVSNTIRLGAHMQFSVVQLFDRPIICYAHTVQLNDRSTVMSAHMQLNSCCNDKLC
jgi:hypothetical protein